MTITNSSADEIARAVTLLEQIEAMKTVPEEGHYEVKHRGCTAGMWEDAYEVESEEWVVDIPSSRVPDISQRKEAHEQLVMLSRSHVSPIVRAVAARGIGKECKADQDLLNEVLEKVMELAQQNCELKKETTKLQRNADKLSEELKRSQSRGLVARVLDF